MSYRRKKNFIIFAIFLLALSILFLLFSLLAETKSRGNIILSALNYVFDCCVLFFNKVTTFIVLEKMTLAYAGLAFLSYGIVEGIWDLLSGIRKVRELESKLEIQKRIQHKGNIVNIFRADTISTAFTMGFFKPQIYVSTGMWNTLDSEELKSVIEHETHHVREMDPLKVVILRFIGKVFFFVPLVSHLLKIFEEAMEKSADDSVRSAGISELSLASALIKVQRSGGGIVPVASFADIDSKGLIETRLVRLLEPEKEKRAIIPRKIISITALLYLVLLVSAFTLPDNYARKTGECIHAKGHSSCSQMSPEECRKHCEQMRMEKR
jgi:Zn-dependent protease with chaperone function